ncbi:MAG: hypothetical protein IJK89_00120 [Clostridia bacterium]|nr:hypothetical protein [Clostridia bacterium]
MKKIIALLLCISLFLSLTPSVAWAADDPAAGDLSIATLSDIRYFPDALAGDKGEAYYTYTESAGVNGRDQNALLEAAFASLRQQAEKHGLDCVVICGDLTLGGEYLGAQELAEKLYLFAFETGLRVYVINGDRDVNNPGACDFSSNLKKPAKGVTQAEFAQLFSRLGYNDAYHVYQPLGSGVQGALSYSVRLDEGYRLILADCCRYTADCTAARTDEREEGFSFSEGLLQWVLAEAAEAKKTGETPLLFTHGGVVPINDFQEYLQPESLVDNAYQLRDTLAEAGILCAFSGGLNAADTNVYDSDCGLPLYSVSSPSVTQFPFAYRVTKFDAGNDGSVDLYFEQHDCDEASPVAASGGVYPTPYRAIGFARQYGGSADAAGYLNTLAREKLGELCEDIVRAGGVKAYVEKLFGVDIRSAVVSAVGTGIRLGPVTVLNSSNVLSFIDDLDESIMQSYVRQPSRLYEALGRAVKAFVELKVSDVPCKKYLNAYGFGSKDRGGTLGDLLLSLTALVRPGDENISDDAFLQDAIRSCASPEFIARVVEVFRTYVVDGILVDKILGNTEFHLGALLNTGVLADAVYVQMFFSVILAVMSSRLMTSATGTEAWDAVAQLFTDGSDLSVGAVLDLMLNAEGASSGRTVDEFLDTVFGLLFGEEQRAAMGDSCGAYLKALCYDDTADTGARRGYPGAGTVQADEDDMRVPSMVQIAVNGNQSFTVTWFTKYSVRGTDIELIKEGGSFTGVPTNSQMIAYDTSDSVYNAFGFDCGNYGFFPYARSVVKHRITVRNLSQGMKLRFRIGDAEKNLWKECAFETGTKDRAFTFLHLCDSDGVTDAAFAESAAVLRAAEEEFDPSFIVHSGNFVRYPYNDAQWARALNCAADVYSRVPLMYASGPNDANGYYSVQKHLTYSRTPTQFEEDGVYYSFDYANAHFTVLNANALQTDNTLSARQLSWLENDLNAPADWKILVLYAPLFCVAPANENLEAQLNRLIGKYHVDLVLESGAGAYMRSHLLKDGSPTDALIDTVKLDGRNYPVYEENGCFAVTCGGMFGGDTAELSVRGPYTAVAQRFQTPVFSAVTVDGDTLLVGAFVLEDGKLQRVDSYGLRKASASFLQGDADMDGKVTSADARLTLRIAVGLNVVTPITKAAADMDGDIYVSSADARLVLRTSVGLEPAPKQVRKFLYEIAAYQNA